MLFDGNSQRYIAPKNVELTFEKAYDKKKKELLGTFVQISGEYIKILLHNQFVKILNIYIEEMFL